MTTAARFLEFARTAADGGSPLYAEWADGVARDPGLVEIIDRAPSSKRQPVLVLGVCRILGAPLGPFDGLRDWMHGNSAALVGELDRRLTQTNDVRRAAPIALALAEAQIDGPIALVEVGASAGLGLYLDRFATAVTTRSRAFRLGSPTSTVELKLDIEGEWTGAEDPRLPPVAARLGLDLEPLPPTEPDSRRWLETLLWPGQEERLQLLRRALDLASAEPPTLIRGDAVNDLAALLDRVPPGVTPVVVTAGTLVYLPGIRRQAFVDLVGKLGVRWIGYERTGLLAGVHSTLPDPERAARGDAFATLSLDGRALAVGSAHGTRLLAV